MAWLYMLLVVLVFYTPVVGVGAFLLRQDIEISILGLRFAIPFTGSLRLLVVSLLAWWVPYVVTRWAERHYEFDLLGWLDDHLRFVHLRERWLYALLPYLSSNITLWLARIGFWVSLAKIFMVFLLAVAVAFLIPGLVGTVLPGLATFLAGHFVEVAWVQTLASWIDGALADWLAGPAVEWLHSALASVFRFDLHASLLALSTLVLAANQAHEAERGERYRLDVKQMQEKRKQEQKDIVVL